MADNYGSDDDIPGDADNYDNVEEENSDDSQFEKDYTSEHSEDEGNGEENPDQDDDQENQSENQSQQSINNYEVMEEAAVNQQPNERKITSPFMTKFQKAKIIGVRAVQISKNAPLYLNSQNVANMNWDPITIAEKELAEKKIPFIIRRYLPDGSFQDWKLADLKTFD